MTDTGRAEALVEKMQGMFFDMHTSRKGVLSDKEVIDKITWVAENYGAGFNGNVTSADDDNLNVLIMKTQDVRLQKANNTKVVICERLSQAIHFAAGETLGAIEARAIASSNEVAVRIARTIAAQIIQALDKGLTYSPVFPTANVKYEVGAAPNKAIFNGFIASYKVPSSKIQGKYYGRVALIGAKNSHESESNKRVSTVEEKVMNMEAALSLGIANADAIEKKFQDIQIKLADTENRLQNIENRLKNTEDLIQNILDGDDPGDPEDPNNPVYG